MDKTVLRAELSKLINKVYKTNVVIGEKDTGRQIEQTYGIDLKSFFAILADTIGYKEATSSDFNGILSMTATQMVNNFFNVIKRLKTIRERR